MLDVPAPALDEVGGQPLTVLSVRFAGEILRKLGEVGIEQREEGSKGVVLAAMGSGSNQDEMAVGVPRKSLQELVTLVAAPPLVGVWAARVDLASHPTLLWLKVTETQDDDYIASLRLNPVPEGGSQLASMKVTLKGSSWTVVGGEAPNRVQLDIRRSGDSFSATYTVGTATGQTQLRRVSHDAGLHKRLRGTYALPSGES